MNKLWVVIPAAGESKRFKDQGYMDPKPLIQLISKTGEYHCMLGFVYESLFPIADVDNLVIALPGGVHLPDTIDDIEHHVVHIQKTLGQADTIHQALLSLPSEDSVLIQDCDTILKTKDIQFLINSLQVYDMTLAITKTLDPNASRVDRVPFPTRFEEKKPISEWGIIGVRGFNNIGRLRSALGKTLDQCMGHGVEPYLSMAMNEYAGTKFAHKITEYVDLGTPERIKEAGWEILT